MKFIEVDFMREGGTFASRTYNYKTLLDVSVDDLVVVQVYDTYAVAKVRKVSSIPNKIATKWAIQKVDVEYGKGLLEKDIKKAEILAMLDAKLKARAETSKYDVLADDKEAAELLKQLREL